MQPTTAATGAQPGVKSLPAVFRDPEQFLAEWNQACRGLSARTRETLERAVMRRERPGQIGREIAVTRERVRQIIEKALAPVRAAAAHNPSCELARARDALSEIAETTGLPVWSFRRYRDPTQREIEASLIKLGVLNDDQLLLLAAAAELVPRPPVERVSSRRLIKPLQKMLARETDGITAEEARHTLKSCESVLRAWPELDLTHFVVATGIGIVNDEGKLTAAPGQPGAAPRDRIAHNMLRTLREAGECLQIAEITSRSAARARNRGEREVYSPARCSAIALSDDRFRWVGVATFGLAEWNVGHSDPNLRSSRRIGVISEIDHLLHKRDTIPFPALMHHLNSRFQVMEASVRVAIRNSPHVTLVDGVVRYAKPGEKKSPQPPPTGQLNPEALTVARERLGMTKMELSRRIGCNSGMISKYEKGIQSPRPERVKQLADALETRPESLLHH